MDPIITSLEGPPISWDSPALPINNDDAAQIGRALNASLQDDANYQEEISVGEKINA
jgi:hypothetical protein